MRKPLISKHLLLLFVVVLLSGSGCGASHLVTLSEDTCGNLLGRELALEEHDTLLAVVSPLRLERMYAFFFACGGKVIK